MSKIIDIGIKADRGKISYKYKDDGKITLNDASLVIHKLEQIKMELLELEFDPEISIEKEDDEE